MQNFHWKFYRLQQFTSLAALLVIALFLAYDYSSTRYLQAALVPASAESASGAVDVRPDGTVVVAPQVR